jgi:hypothetical protein
MEENKTQKVVEKKIAKKVSKPVVKKTEDKIIELHDGGFNINQIGSMLAVHTQYVKTVIQEANEKL